MKQPLPADARVERFIEWAKACSVNINGVLPASIPGHGFGIVAARPIEVDLSQFTIEFDG